MYVEQIQGRCMENRQIIIYQRKDNGIKKPVPFYNLDAIISVGYRRSKCGIQFRQWANKVLKDKENYRYQINSYV